MKIFWSWQSDTPGRTGRHFIRRVLLAAIDELKLPEDIEEPSEREAKDALHLDQDRQGVSGSPDLAPLILAKIASSTVIIADVTPVSTIPGRKDGEEEIPEKRNMNPNVAIELGYGMRALSDRNFLMVLNTHYGERRYLPFDLSGKGGPIMFSLPPDADATKMKSEAANLKGKLITALRPFISATTSSAVAFDEIPATLSAAAYFKANEVLATVGERHDRVEYGQNDGKGFYLRVIPRAPRAAAFTRGELLGRLQKIGLCPLLQQPSGIVSSNVYGAIVVEPDSIHGGPVNALTQLMTNGEIWGLCPALLVSNGYGNFVPCRAFERTFQYALRRYVDFLSGSLGIAPPYTVEAGAVGLEKRYLAVNPPGDSQPGPFYDDAFKVRLVLNELTDDVLNKFLLRVFEELFRLAGERRPAGLFGFPPGE